jgi:hypothetical protein
MGGQVVCEHCHVQSADNFEAYDLRRGERVQFEAVVMSYRKTADDGVQLETDYSLWNPTNIRLLDRPAEVLPILDTPKETATQDTAREETNTSMQGVSETLTVDEAAAQWDVCATTVMSRIGEFKLKPVNLYVRPFRYQRANLERAFADGQPQSYQEPGHHEPTEPTTPAKGGGNSLQAVKVLKELGTGLGWDTLQQIIDILRD